MGATANWQSSVSPAVTLNTDIADGNIYEQIAEFWINNMTTVKQSLDSYIETAQGMERQRAEEVRNQVEKEIKALRKSKSGNILDVLGKVFSGVLTALAVVAAVVAPSPVTIAMAVLAVAMFTEQIVAEARGNESLIGQGFSKLAEQLAKHLPKGAAAAIATIIIMTAMMLVAAAITKGAGAIPALMKSTSTASGGAAATGTSSAARAAGTAASTSTQSAVATIRNVLGIGPNFTNREIAAKLIEYVESIMITAEAGIHMARDKTMFDISRIRKEVEMQQAEIQELEQLIEMTWEGLNTHQAHFERLMQLLDKIFRREARQF